MGAGRCQSGKLSNQRCSLFCFTLKCSLEKLKIGGIYTRQIKTLEDGTYDLEELEAMLPSMDDRCVGNVKMVATENSHNWCGGRIVPLEFFTKLGKLLRERNVKLHVDGSRVITVAVASGIDVKTWVKDCDSINFCFSKVTFQLAN